MTNASISPASSLPFVTNIGVDSVQGAAIASFRADVEAALRQKDYSLALRQTADGVERFVQNGNRYGEATALFLQGMVYRYLENCPAALRCLKASQALWEFLNDSDGVTRCLQELGGTSIQQADYTAAMVYFQECLRLCEQSGDRRREIAARSNLATLHLEVGDCAAGLEGLLRCLVHY
jgi:tetratricopeptide (TPR) repeat protein